MGDPMANQWHGLDNYLTQLAYMVDNSGNKPRPIPASVKAKWCAACGSAARAPLSRLQLCSCALLAQVEQ